MALVVVARLVAAGAVELALLGLIVARESDGALIMQKCIEVPPRQIRITATVQIADHHRRFVGIYAVAEGPDMGVEILGPDFLVAVDQQVPQVGLVEIVEPRFRSLDLRAQIGLLFPVSADPFGLGVEVERSQRGHLRIVQRDRRDRQPQLDALTGRQFGRPVRRFSVRLELAIISREYKESNMGPRAAFADRLVAVDHEIPFVLRLGRKPQPCRGLLALGKIHHPDLHQQNRRVIEGDILQVAVERGQDRGLFVIDRPRLPPGPQQRQVAILQFPPAPQRIGRQAQMNIHQSRPASICRLVSRELTGRLNQRSAGGDFNVAVGIADSSRRDCPAGRGQSTAAA